MELFRYRHLALGCAAFILGLYVSYFHLGTAMRLCVLILSLVCAFSLALIYLITKKRSVLDKFIKYAPLCFFLALSMLVSILSYGRDEKIFDYQGENRQIRAEVKSEVWENEYSGIYVIKISEIDGEKVKAEAVLQAYDTPLDSGNEISLSGNIEALSDSKYGFDEKSAYLDDGILVSVDCEEITVTNSKIKAKSIFERVNEFFDKRFENNLNSDTYALFSALLLGNKDNLSPSVRRDFARVGLSHVLALSGMHLTLLTTLFSLALSLLKIPKPINLVFLIFVIGFFVALTGFSDSCVRAGLMMAIYFSLRLLGKSTDSFTSLLLSVSLILTVSPYHIFSVSLILSFLSMLGCIVSSKIIKYAKISKRVKNRIPRYVIYTVITSLVVLSFTSVIIYLYFGEISLFSPISSLVLVPIFSGFIYFAPFLLLLCGVLYVSIPFIFIAEQSTKLIENLISLISKIKGISLPIYGFWQVVGIFGVLGVFVLAMVVRRKYLFKSLALLSVFVVCFAIGTVSNVLNKQLNTYVSAFNHSGGDYLTIEDGGEISVIDITSAKRKYSSFPSSLIGELCYTEIEKYALTSYSSNAPSYVESIVSRNIVRELYLPNPKDEEESALSAEISEIAKNQGTRVAFYENSFPFGESEIEINRISFDRSAYDSVSASFKINGVSVLYLGASSYEAFDYFGETHAPNADIVIFGESGPKYKLEYTYKLNSVDYAVYMGESYEYASEKTKSATQGKEFFPKNDYARIKILDT